jgi:hypothetical protein
MGLGPKRAEPAQLTEWGAQVAPLMEARARRADGAIPPNGWDQFKAVLDKAERLRRDFRDAQESGSPDWSALTEREDRVVGMDADVQRDRALAQQMLAIYEREGIFDDLAALAAIERAHRPETSGFIASWEFREGGAIRELARACNAALALAWRAGDGATAARRLREGLALARLASQRPRIIDHTTGALSATIMLDLLSGMQWERPADAPTLRALLLATEGHALAPIGPALRVERLSAMETLERFLDSRGRVDPDAVAQSFDLRFSDGTTLVGLLRRRPPEGAQVRATLDTLFDAAVRLTELPAQERALAWEAHRRAWETVPGEQAITALLATAAAQSTLRPLLREVDTHETRLGGVRLLLAIALHRAETGAYPATLDALVPEHLPVLPRDPLASDGAFRYRRFDTPDEHGRGFTLYSVALDGDDNDGAWPTDPRTWPMERPLPGFDYVFNRPPTE